MEDFVDLVRYYLLEKNLPKEIDCTYDTSLKLSEIAAIINNISNYNVPIRVEDEGNDLPYIGKPNTLLNFRGLKYGISKVYSILKYP